MYGYFRIVKGCCLATSCRYFILYGYLYLMGTFSSRLYGIIYMRPCLRVDSLVGILFKLQNKCRLVSEASAASVATFSS